MNKETAAEILKNFQNLDQRVAALEERATNNDHRERSMCTFTNRTYTINGMELPSCVAHDADGINITVPKTKEDADKLRALADNLVRLADLQKEPA